MPTNNKVISFNDFSKCLSLKTLFFKLINTRLVLSEKAKVKSLVYLPKLRKNLEYKLF